MIDDMIAYFLFSTSLHDITVLVYCIFSVDSEAILFSWIAIKIMIDLLASWCWNYRNMENVQKWDILWESVQ